LTPKWCGTDNGVCDIENLCPYFESQSDYDRLKNDYEALKQKWCNLALDNTDTNDQFMNIINNLKEGKLPPLNVGSTEGFYVCKNGWT
jgi:hypothetical protein